MIVKIKAKGGESFVNVSAIYYISDSVDEDGDLYLIIGLDGRWVELLFDSNEELFKAKDSLIKLWSRIKMCDIEELEQ